MQAAGAAVGFMRCLVVPGGRRREGVAALHHPGPQDGRLPAAAVSAGKRVIYYWSVVCTLATQPTEKYTQMSRIASRGALYEHPANRGN